MPLEGYTRIRLAHPFAVVDDLDQRLARILNEKPDLGCARINGILQQLFHGAARPLDDLSGCDLVRDVIGQ